MPPEPLPVTTITWRVDPSRGVDGHYRHWTFGTERPTLRDAECPAMPPAAWRGCDSQDRFMGEVDALDDVSVFELRPAHGESRCPSCSGHVDVDRARPSHRRDRRVPRPPPRRGALPAAAVDLTPCGGRSGPLHRLGDRGLGRVEQVGRAEHHELGVGVGRGRVAGRRVEGVAGFVHLVVVAEVNTRRPA